MEYEVVFDISQAGYRLWYFPSGGLIFIGVGILFNRFRDRVFQNWSPRWAKIFCRVWLGFSIFWTLISFTFTFGEYYFLNKAYKEGRFRVVEGVVTNFKPMPYEGHARESFDIQDKTFKYSNYNITAGFNDTASHGGPIREGLNVRASYVGNAIIKLEVEK